MGCVPTKDQMATVENVPSRAHDITKWKDDIEEIWRREIEGLPLHTDIPRLCVKMVVKSLGRRKEVLLDDGEVSGSEVVSLRDGDLEIKEVVAVSGEVMGSGGSRSMGRKSESGSATLERSESGSASLKRSESGSALLKRSESGDLSASEKVVNDISILELDESEHSAASSAHIQLIDADVIDDNVEIEEIDIIDNEINVDGEIFFDGGHTTDDISRLNLMKDLIESVSVMIGDAATEEFIHTEFQNFVRETGDQSVQLLEWFKALREQHGETPTIKVFKVAHQKVIFPAFYTLRGVLKDIGNFKDKRGTWSINIIEESPNMIRVIHKKTQQSSDFTNTNPDFEFDWSLSILIDLSEDEILDINIHNSNLVLDPELPEDMKQQKTTIFSSHQDI